MIPGADGERRLFALLAALLLIAAYSRLDRVAPRLQALFRLPATLLHESAHFAVALVTGGRPTGFSLVPRCEESRTLFGGFRRRWVLGSVSIRNPGAVSTLPSALAPLLLLPAAFFLYCRWFRWFPADLPHSLLLGTALFFCCTAAVPSRKDVAVAVSRPVGLLLYGAVAGIAILFRDDLLPLLRFFVS